METYVIKQSYHTYQITDTPGEVGEFILLGPSGEDKKLSNTWPRPYSYELEFGVSARRPIPFSPHLIFSAYIYKGNCRFSLLRRLVTNGRQ